MFARKMSRQIFNDTKYLLIVIDQEQTERVQVDFYHVIISSHLMHETKKKVSNKLMQMEFFFHQSIFSSIYEKKEKIEKKNFQPKF